MRDIRFRAFDKEKNIMIYDYDQSMGKIYNLPLGSSLRDCVFIIGLANKTLMQFIGLHDKNNSPIYEGDIVATESNKKGVIRFEMGLFGIDWDFNFNSNFQTMLGTWGSKVNLRQMYDGFNSKIAVIGNIHEHPHLLESA
jgi:uncharacterized phage protein (TIGR01671 family)